jgi:foldase protein PrsA
MVECKAIMLDDEHRAMDAWEQAKRNPNDFVRLVKEFSIEPISRAVGGDIPPIRRHVGSKKVVGEAFKLKPGEISGIIQTGSGRFVILLCVRHVEFW